VIFTGPGRAVSIDPTARRRSRRRRAPLRPRTLRCAVVAIEPPQAGAVPHPRRIPVGPKHIALYVIIALVIVAAAWYLMSRRSPSA